MTRIPLTAPLLGSLLVGALAGTPAPAQRAFPAGGLVQPLPGTTEADRLSAVMRRVAAAPTDVAALAEAGELSLRLDDASGAAALLARAEKIDPQNGRVKAGMGAILVRAERPGEALRYFNQAEGYGWPAARYASDRGLALDLLGQQERAQRDYRLALRGGRDDETLRRYALSLAVSGRRGPALEVLEPLLRQQDRGAWRVQAFVLALTGDAAGADRIAAAMMPQAAAGLGPFFRRLPGLTATDRAFAVHFGEVSAGPERLADARLAPAMPALAPEADPFARRVQVAAVMQPPAVVAAQPKRRAARTAGSRRAAPGQVALAQASPLPPATAPASQTAPAPVALASVSSLPPAVTLTRRVLVSAAPVQAAAPPPVPATPAGTGATVPAASPPASPPVQDVRQAAVSAAPAPALATAPAPPLVAPVRSNESILARIVASITVPQSELDAPAAAVPPAADRQVAARERADRAAAVRTIRAAAPAPRRGAARPRASAPEEAADLVADAAPARRGARPAKAAATPPEEEVASTTTAPVAKAPGPRERARLAAQAKAAERKVAARKEAAAKETATKRAARAEPERIWVQVAGGANEGDLGKAWKAAQDKAGTLKGRQGFTTPSRATNRVVTGPFKTAAEARAFVNKLRGEGVAAFSFTSDAGQKMAKLPAK